MNSPDKKDLEIRKLKEEVKRLLEDIETRVRNYMYNMDQQKTNGRKIVYVYKSESDHPEIADPPTLTTVPEPKVQSHVSEGTDPRIRELQYQLQKKSNELAKAQRDLKLANEKISELRSIEGRLTRQVEELKGSERKRKEDIERIVGNEKSMAEQRVKEELQNRKNMESQISRLEAEIQVMKAEGRRNLAAKETEITGKFNKEKEAMIKAHSDKIAEFAETLKLKSAESIAEIDRLKNDIEIQKKDFGQKLQEKDASIKTLQSEIAELKAENQKLKKDLQAKPLGRQSSKIMQRGSLTEQEQVMKQQIKQKIRTIYTLNDKIKQLQTSLEDKDKQLKQQGAYFSKLEYEMKQEFEQEISKYSATISQLNQEINNNIMFRKQSEVETVNLNRKIEELQMSLQAKLIKKEQEEKQMKKEVKRLSELNEENIENILDRDDTIITDQQKITQLLEDNAGLKKKVQSLTKDNQQLQKDCEKFRSSSLTMGGNIHQLNQQIENLQYQIEDLKAENNQLQKKSQALSKIETENQPKVSKVEIQSPAKSVDTESEKTPSLNYTYSQKQNSQLMLCNAKLTQQVQQLKQQLSHINGRLSLKTQINKTSQQLQYKQTIERLEAQLQNLKSQLAQQQFKNCDLVRQYENTSCKNQLMFQQLSSSIRHIQSSSEIDHSEQINRQRDQMELLKAEYEQSKQLYESRLTTLEAENKEFRRLAIAVSERKHSERITDDYTNQQYLDQILRVEREKEELNKTIAELKKKVEEQKVAYEMEIRKLKEEYRQLLLKEYPNLAYEQRSQSVSSGDKDILTKLKKQDQSLKNIMRKQSWDQPKITEVDLLKIPEDKMMLKKKFHSQHAMSQVLYPPSEAELIGQLENEVNRLKKERKQNMSTYQHELNEKQEHCKIRLKEKNKQLSEIQNDLQEKQNVIKKMKTDLQLLHKQKQQALENNKKMQDALENYKAQEKKLAETENSIADIKKQLKKVLSQKQTIISQLRKDIESANEQKSKLIEEKKKQMTTIEAKLNETQNLKSQLEKDFQSMQKKKDQQILLLIAKRDHDTALLRAQIKEQNKKATDIFLEKQNIKEESAKKEEQFKNGLQKLQKSYEDLIAVEQKTRQDNIRYERELAQSEKDYKLTLNQFQSLKSQFQKVVSQKENLRKQNEEVKQSKQKLLNNLHQSNEQISALKGQNAQQLHKLSLQNQQISQFEKDIKNITQNQAEQNGLNIKTIEGIKKSHQQQLRKLNNQIESLKKQPGLKLQFGPQLQNTAHFGFLSPIQKADSVVTPVHMDSSTHEVFDLNELKKAPSDMQGQKLTKTQFKQLYRRMSIIGEDNQELKTDLAQIQAENKNLKTQLSMQDISSHKTLLAHDRQMKEKAKELDNAQVELEIRNKKILRLEQEIKDLESANLDLEVERAALEDELRQVQRCSRFVKEARADRQAESKPQPKKTEPPKSKQPQDRSKSKTPTKTKTPIKGSSTKERSESEQKRIIAKQVTDQIKQYTEINDGLNSKILAEQAKSKALQEEIQRLKAQLDQCHDKIQDFKKKEEQWSQIHKRNKEKITELESTKQKEADLAKNTIELLQKKIQNSEISSFKDKKDGTVEDPKPQTKQKNQKSQISNTKNDHNQTNLLSENVKQLISELESKHKKQLQKLHLDHKSNTDKLKQQYEHAMNDIKKASDSNIESYKHYIGSLYQTIQNLSDKKKLLQNTALTQANSKIVTLQQHLVMMQSMIDRIDKNQQQMIDGTGKIQKSQQEMVDMLKQITNLNNKIGQLEKNRAEEQETSRVEVRGYQDQIQKLERDLQQLTREQCDRVQSLEKLLSQREIQISGVDEQLRISDQQDSMVSPVLATPNRKQQQSAVEELLTIPREQYQQEMQELLTNMLILQQRHQHQQEMMQQLARDFHTQSEIVKTLTEKIEKMDVKDPNWMINSSESLQNQKRILKQIQQIENIKSVKQAELEDCKNTFISQLASRDQEIEQLKNQISQLTDKSQRLTIKNHDLQVDIERLRKKQTPKQQPAQKLTSDYTNLLNVYRFVQKRSQRIGQRMLENESDKKAMIKEVEQYKASNIKFMNQVKTLESTLHQTIQNAKEEKQKAAADFKIYTDKLLECYVAQQKKIKELKDQLTLFDKNERIVNIKILKLEDELKQSKKSYFQKEVMQHYPRTPNPTAPNDQDWQTAQQRSNKNFQRKFTKDPNMNEAYFMEHPVPVEVRKPSATIGAKDTERLERELQKTKQELAACTQQLIVLKSNMEAREKEKNKLQLENSDLTKKIESLGKELVIQRGEVGYQKIKMGREFEQFINSMAKSQQKISVSKKSIIRPRKVSIEQNNTTQELSKERYAHQKLFKKICDECYSIFKVLPFTSSDNLFEPETEQDLMNILGDIKDFTTNYVKREEAAEQKRSKRQDSYNNLVLLMVADSQTNEEKFEDIVQKIPDFEFESLRQKAKGYYRRLKESQPVRTTNPITHPKKTTSFGEEQQTNSFKNFNSGSEEFFEFKDSAGLQDLLLQRQELKQLQSRVKETQAKYDNKCKQVTDLLIQVEALKKAEEKCQKEHNKKTTLLVKGRD